MSNPFQPKVLSILGYDWICLAQSFKYAFQTVGDYILLGFAFAVLLPMGFLASKSSETILISDQMLYILAFSASMLISYVKARKLNLLTSGSIVARSALFLRCRVSSIISTHFLHLIMLTLAYILLAITVEWDLLNLAAVTSLWILGSILGYLGSEASEKIKLCNLLKPNFVTRVGVVEAKYSSRRKTFNRFWETVALTRFPNGASPEGLVVSAIISGSFVAILASYVTNGLAEQYQTPAFALIVTTPILYFWRIYPEISRFSSKIGVPAASAILGHCVVYLLYFLGCTMSVFTGGRFQLERIILIAFCALTLLIITTYLVLHFRKRDEIPAKKVITRELLFILILAVSFPIVAPVALFILVLLLLAQDERLRWI